MAELPAIIVHGGAGTVDDERVAVCAAGVERAAAAGWAVLSGGGSALDAVEAAVRILEDDPEFNAGRGSVLTRAGGVEVDALVVDDELRAGAVGAVPWLGDPIRLARRVLERGEHVLLVGEGALAFAREEGIQPAPPHTLLTPRAIARFDARRKEGVGDTVGACALDAAGRLAAASSTGGIAGKRPGRVGDSPIPGAGAYADRGVGAASATGDGEAILRTQLTRDVVDRLRAGAAPTEAAVAAIERMGARTGGEGGVIVLGADGRIGHFTSTRRMPWAAIAGGRAFAGMEPR